jgi:uncharacterized repeat protein (TIGR04052 family)
VGIDLDLHTSDVPNVNMIMTTLRAKNLLSLGAALGLALLSGCGSSSDSTQAPVATQKQVAVSFRALVGGDPFSCTSTYTGIGTSADPAGQVFTPRDFRLYVHDVRLVNGAGADVPLAVTEDGAWQHAGVTLLDFEDGSGTCVNGNAATNSRVVGTVPAGSYVGLKFKVGVPFELNHLAVAEQQSPLNVTAMYWSWTSGYRFVRIEGTTPGALLHLGSAGCTLVDASDPRKGSTCTHPNRVEVDFPAFDVDTNRVALDLADLWAATDITTNVTGTSTGCMSAPTDVDCAPIFQRLGLPFGADAGGLQMLFTKE